MRGRAVRVGSIAAVLLGGALVVGACSEDGAGTATTSAPSDPGPREDGGAAASGPVRAGTLELLPSGVWSVGGLVEVDGGWEPRRVAVAAGADGAVRRTVELPIEPGRFLARASIVEVPGSGPVVVGTVCAVRNGPEPGCGEPGVAVAFRLGTAGAGPATPLELPGTEPETGGADAAGWTEARGVVGERVLVVREPGSGADRSAPTPVRAWLVDPGGSPAEEVALPVAVRRAGAVCADGRDVFVAVSQPGPGGRTAAVDLRMATPASGTTAPVARVPVPASLQDQQELVCLTGALLLRSGEWPAHVAVVEPGGSTVRAPVTLAGRVAAVERSATGDRAVVTVTGRTEGGREGDPAGLTVEYHVADATGLVPAGGRTTSVGEAALGVLVGGHVVDGAAHAAQPGVEFTRVDP